MKVFIVFYSMYGHIYNMAEAVAQGAREVGGVDVELRRVPETLPQDVLEKMGAVEAQKAFAHVPVATVDELASADAIIFGTPTRFMLVGDITGIAEGINRRRLIGTPPSQRNRRLSGQRKRLSLPAQRIAKRCSARNSMPSGKSQFDVCG